MKDIFCLWYILPDQYFCL